MGPLKWTLAALLVIAAPAARAQAVERWNPHIEQASARFGIPGDWIRRVIRAESGGRTTANGRPITSRAGAMGLMQLMPRTWAEMRDLHALGSDPYDPRDNILAGTAYLRAMYDRFGYPGLFAAYNAGPARYAGHLATGRGLPAETLAYVAEVSSAPPERSPPSRGKPPGSGHLFALVRSAPGSRGPARIAAPRDPIFVRLTAAAPASE